MASIRTRQRPGRLPYFEVSWETPEGERATKAFSYTPKTKATKGAEAKAHAAKVEKELHTGSYVDPSEGKVRLSAYVAQWWPKAERKLRPSTRARDWSYLNTHVLPHFGDYPLNRVTIDAVEAWAWGLTPRLAPATVEKVVQVLSKIIESAITEGRLVVNPCRRVTLPKVETEEARFLTPDELVALEDALVPEAPAPGRKSTPDRWSLLVPFLSDTGLRIGEAAALRWRDLDLLRLKVTVREVLVEVPKAISGAEAGYVLGPPKTKAGRRTVPMLTRETADRLAERQAGHSPDAFVFALANGSPFRPNQLRARVWRPAVIRAGLAAPAPTPHALRHTAVALWIDAGVVDPFKLMTWAGHRQVSTIYGLYAHLLPTDAGEYRDAMSASRAAARERATGLGEVVALASRRR